MLFKKTGKRNMVKLRGEGSERTPELADQEEKGKNC